MISYKNRRLLQIISFIDQIKTCRDAVLSSSIASGEKLLSSSGTYPRFASAVIRLLHINHLKFILLIVIPFQTEVCQSVADTSITTYLFILLS